MMFAGHQNDRADRDPRRIGRHDELAESRVAALRIQWRRASQDDDLVREVCAAGPHLGAGQNPAAVGADGLGRRRGEIGPGLRLAHADRREQLSRNDVRQDAPALFLAAVRQQPRTHLPVGDPVCGHWRAGGQQFLGDHVAVQMTQTVTAVLGRDGQTEESRRTEARAELRVPTGQPGVDGRLPAELGAVGNQELAQRAAKLGQFRFVGAQRRETERREAVSHLVHR